MTCPLIPSYAAIPAQKLASFLGAGQYSTFLHKMNHLIQILNHRVIDPVLQQRLT
jgi:hypothetical protein